jgi:hypothetical protein
MKSRLLGRLFLLYIEYDQRTLPEEITLFGVVLLQMVSRHLSVKSNPSQLSTLVQPSVFSLLSHLNLRRLKLYDRS